MAGQDPHPGQNASTSTCRNDRLMAHRVTKDTERVLSRVNKVVGDWVQISETHQLREETSQFYSQVLTDLQEIAKLWPMVLVTLPGCRDWRSEPRVCSRLGVGVGPAIQPTTVLSSGHGRLPQEVNEICSLTGPRSLKQDNKGPRMVVLPGT